VSIGSEILKELWNAELNYKGVRVNFFGIPKFMLYKPNSVRSNLSRLKKKGYIEFGDNYRITSLGKKYYETRVVNFRHFSSNFNKKAQKNLLFIFDIPYDKKRYRDWLRRQLVFFGYVMVQKSVWIGPSPLPKKFLDYLKELQIQANVKMFKLSLD